MTLNKIISGGLLALILVFVSCFENGNPSNPPVISTAKSYGAFLVKLIPATSEDDAYIKFDGGMRNGPTPPLDIFKLVKTSDPCKLFIADRPTCTPDCGLGFKCVSTDSCMPESQRISVGILTLDGMKCNGEKKTYTIEPGEIALDYQLVGPYPDYPPTSEGDIITLTASGSGSAAPFTLKCRGIAPLVVSDDPIVLADGQPITLKWEPPKVPGVSTISILIDISYHGGTKGKIEFECEDNGSVTIPGAMLDELKSYGLAGWPRVDITRQSVSVDETSKAKFIVQCMVTKFLTIPGVKSCDGEEECPDGQTCKDRRCQ